MDFKYESGRIFLEDINGKIIAEITYTDIDKDTVSVDHTFVDESLRGMGVADKLMKELCAKMKQYDKRILPICSYAVAWSKKHNEYGEMFIQNSVRE